MRFLISHGLPYGAFTNLTLEDARGHKHGEQFLARMREHIDGLLASPFLPKERENLLRGIRQAIQ